MESVVRLPPGFRFRPTDEELVEYYLRRKVLRYPLPASVIPDIDLSRYDPWDIPGGGAGFSERERYFFAWREAKCGGGGGCRVAGCGHWKPAGKDQKVTASGGDRVVGVKGALVFYRGRPFNGSRTNWVMHEYRLADAPIMQAEGWVLCHMFQKRRVARGTGRWRPDANAIAGLARRIGGDVAPSDSESSCVTELSEESGGEEEGCRLGDSSRIKKRRTES